MVIKNDITQTECKLWNINKNINPKTKRVKKIAFGDVHGGLTAKVSNPKARKSFAARHQCHLKNDRTKAGYWACRINRYAHLWGGKTYPGFW